VSERLSARPRLPSRARRCWGSLKRNNRDKTRNKDVRPLGAAHSTLSQRDNGSCAVKRGCWTLTTLHCQSFVLVYFVCSRTVRRSSEIVVSDLSATRYHPRPSPFNTYKPAASSSIWTAFNNGLVLERSSDG